MTEVERLVSASMVTFAIEDPASADARWCIEQYFAELNARFDAGFDPSLSISADAHELTAPNGLLFIARLREDPVGCGALKFHDGAPAELKRMWVARVDARTRPRAAAPAGAGGAGRISRALTWFGWRRTGRSRRRSHSTVAKGTARSRLQRRAVRAPLVREAPPLRSAIEDAMLPATAHGGGGSLSWLLPR